MKRIFPILLITLVSCCSRNSEVSAQTETTNGSGTIVLYYSYTGSIQAIVDEIQKLKNVDVVEVQPVEKNVKYEANNYAIGSALISAIRNNPDAAESYPAVEAVSIDFNKYSNVIVATPLWWSNMAAPMQSFLFEHGSELAGKNIGLIVSSASSGISSVVTDAKRLIPNGNFNDESLWINDGNRSSMPNLVNEWIEQLNFTYAEKEINTYAPMIKKNNELNDSQIYDLQGRKIDSLGKGQIYIQNGEKRVKQF